MKCNGIGPIGQVRKTSLRSRSVNGVLLLLAILSVARCGRMFDADSDELFFADPANVAAANEAQAIATQWYAAFESNVAPSVRGAVPSSSKNVSQAELEQRVIHILNSIKVPQGQVRSAVTSQNQWYGRYGGQNTYTTGTTSNGGNVRVRTRYNPNIQSGGGTATGGGVVSYNGSNAAGIAGLHVGLAGVCVGAAGGNKTNGAYGGCGGCVAWSGDAYSGCF